MSERLRIAVIGDATSVAGFHALGFEALSVEDAAEASAAWEALDLDSYGAVFVTEPVYVAIADRIGAIADRTVPAVTVIPAAGSAGGVGAAKLNRAIERALGTTVPAIEEEG